MKTDFLKRRYKLHIVVMSLIIASCIMFSSLFTVITFSNTATSLSSNGFLFCNRVISSLKQQLDANYTNASIMAFINKDYKVIDVNVSEDDVFISIEKNARPFVQTCNCFIADFYNDNNSETYNYIEYDKFIDSMTKKQYNKIAEYLNKPVDENGDYYELLCTEYYDSDEGILPKKVGIVKTSVNNTWYVQDELIEMFELKPKYEEGMLLEKIGESYRNRIDTDFFFGKYEKVFDMDDISLYLSGTQNTTEAEGVYDADLFNKILISNNAHYVLTDYLDYIDTDNGFHYNTSEKLYRIILAYRYNILDYCLVEIIIGVLIIFVVFLLIGGIEIAMWRISKNRYLQEQSRTEMTNSVAHNLKTPLFVISGFAENLKRENDKDKQRHYIEVIQQQTSEMDTLVHRMLDLSKLSSPQITINPEKFSLNSFVSDMVFDYQLCSENEIILNYNSEEEISADKTVLKMAIENLIDNAIKYSDYSSDIVIEISEGYFGISNKCSSISADDIKNLWKPYFRKNDGDNTSGNGIGLSTVKSVLELHKFKYGADYSNNNICFWFRF